MWDRNLGTVPIADVAVTDDGLVVCAGSGRLEYWRFALDGTLLDHDGTRVGWHPRTDGRVVVYHDGTTFIAWTPGAGSETIPGSPVGNNATGVSPAGLIFVQRQADSAFQGGVYCGSVKVADYRPTGIWESHDDGSVAMMDDCNRPAWSPGAGGYAHRAADLVVAEAAEGGILIYLDGHRRILWQGSDTKWPRVAVRGETVAIVCWGDDGLRVWGGTRAEVAALPLDVPPVVVPPAPAHLRMCGYFFRDTAIYPYIAKYGGENPAAPGTHSIIVDDHGLPAEPRADGSTPRMIVGVGQLLHPQMPTWWDRVDAVYVAVEGDPRGLADLCDLARYVMDWRRLEPRPILSYSGAELYTGVLRREDILGVQLYAARGRDPVADIRAQAAALWPRLTAVPRVAIIGQAYDRGGWFTGEQCAAIQPVLYEVAAGWPNCTGLFWFSDSRTGGTRDHEEMRPIHQAIWAQVQKNAAA
ncbi:MAG TPA: hypothetical protein PKZ08_10705 [Vicinamibacterales bacterium]|nr:hypothetical protein [Vicinamibacterales bacterium]